LTYGQSVCQTAEMTLCLSKGGNLCNVITYNIVLANRRLNLLGIAGYVHFVGLLDVISSSVDMFIDAIDVLRICLSDIWNDVMSDRRWGFM